MPSSMPEFEMPPEPPSAAASPALTTEAEPATPAESPDETELHGDGAATRPAARRRLIVGAVLAALAIVGGSTAAIVQGVQRAAEDAATEALTAAALDYLGAIAEGRGDAATALVPVDGPAPLLTDAALADAGRIQELGVTGVELADDSAVVEVAFRTGQGRVERRLDAVREQGAWRLTTSVAERVVIDPRFVPALPRLRDVEIGADGGTLLYPAMYRTDRIERALVTIEASTLVVDGDPSSPTDVAAHWAVAEGLVDEASDLALARAVACQAAGTCAAPPGALLGLGDQRVQRLVEGEGVVIEVLLQVLGATGSGPAQLWVPVLATADASGAVDWHCGAPEARGSSASPVIDIAWGACG